MQGRLGNCWYIQALSSLAARPSLIQNALNCTSLSRFGVYSIRLHNPSATNDTVYLLIDDYVPVLHNRLMFATARDPNVIWPISRLTVPYR